MHWTRPLTVLVPAVLLLPATAAAAVPEDEIVVADRAHDVAGHGPDKDTIDLKWVAYRYNVDRDTGPHLAIEVRFGRAMVRRAKAQVVHTRLEAGGERYLVKFTAVRARMWRLHSGDRERVDLPDGVVKSRGGYADWVLRFDSDVFPADQVDWFRTELWLLDGDGRRIARDVTARTDRPLDISS